MPRMSHQMGGLSLNFLIALMACACCFTTVGGTSQPKRLISPISLMGDDVLYPANISNTYYGSWSDSNRGGVLFFRLYTWETPAKDRVHYVESAITMQDGDYPTENDWTFVVQGIYVVDNGTLYLWSRNDKNVWQNPGTLTPLLPPDVSFDAKDYQTFIPLRLEWDTNNLDSCAAMFSIKFDATPPDPSRTRHGEIITKSDSWAISLFSVLSPDTLHAFATSEPVAQRLRSIRLASAPNEIKGSSITLFDETIPVSSEYHLKGISLSSQCTYMNRTMDAKQMPADFFMNKVLYYVIMVCTAATVQIGLIHKQVEAASSQARAAKVSLLGMTMQALLDVFFLNFHWTFALMAEPLLRHFTVAGAFNAAVFFFEVKLLVLLWKARNPDAFNNGNERMQREIRCMAFRFLFVMTIGLFVVRLLTSWLPVLSIFAYLFWVPQIYESAKNNTKKAMAPWFVVTMSACRILVPLYFLGCPYNFLGNVVTAKIPVTMLVLMVLQVVIVLLQDYLGPQFFIPARFLPPRYDYHRSIPLLTRRSRNRSDSKNNAGSTEMVAIDPAAAHSDNDSLLASDKPQSDSAAGVTANAGSNGSQDAKIDIPHPPTSDDAKQAAADENEFMCPICYCEFEENAPRQSIMVTPCDHVFHTECLLRWMEQKMECPTCRGVLPPP